MNAMQRRVVLAGIGMVLLRVSAFANHVRSPLPDAYLVQRFGITLLLTAALCVGVHRHARDATVRRRTIGWLAASVAFDGLTVLAAQATSPASVLAFACGIGWIVAYVAAAYEFARDRAAAASGSARP